MTAAAPTTPKSRAQARRPALAAACIVSFLIHGAVLAAAHWAWEHRAPVRLPPMFAIPVIDAATLNAPVRQEASAAPVTPEKAEVPSSEPFATPEPQTAVPAALPKSEPEPAPTEYPAAPVRPAWTLNPPVPPLRPAALAHAQSAPPPKPSLSETPAVTPPKPAAFPTAAANDMRDTKGAETAPASHVAVAKASVAGLANPPPDYPWISRRRGEQGRVILDVEVTAKGRARLVHIKRSSGSDRLDRAALKAVKDWRFLPAKRAGEAVPGRIDVPITFRLTD